MGTTMRSRQFRPNVDTMEDRLVLSTVKLTPSIVKVKLAPPTFAMTAAPTQVNLAWNKVSGASQYLVREMINGRWVQLSKLNNKTSSFAISGLSPSTAYRFDVAYVKGGRSNWMPARSAVTLPPAPNVPGTGGVAANNSTVAAWCAAHLGQMVGNGQCADLANQALIATGHETFYQTGGPTGPDSDYVWGQLVATITTANCKTLPMGTIQAGDILQFRNVTTMHTTTYPNGGWSSETMTATHHTAVAAGTESDSSGSGTIVDTFEQNDNDVQLVVRNQWYLADLTGGTIWVYRPINA